MSRTNREHFSAPASAGDDVKGVKFVAGKTSLIATVATLLA
jgi:hypothetical protein